MKIIVANWKMNLDAPAALALAAEIKQGTHASNTCIILCPSTPYLVLIGSLLVDSGIECGAQDCHERESGAFTGEVSAPMLKSVGCEYVILGHSERRQLYGETDALVNAKAAAALKAGLKSIICVGETLAQREAGKAEKIVQSQLEASIPEGATSENTIIAYEPVWAIGSGLTPTQLEIDTMHGHIKNIMRMRGWQPEETKVLYGGSVKAASSQTILLSGVVDGVLVGGASLKAAEFCGIIAAAPKV